MRFSPQRRTIFEHLNFKKWSEPVARGTFWLKMCFSHSGVQFLISPLTTWLRTRRFNEPTFRLTRHTNHWKNTAFRDFSNIWRGCIFFLLTFALLHLLSSDSTSSSDFTFFWLYFIYLLFICFSNLHIVGSLLFKLPSTTFRAPAISQNWTKCCACHEKSRSNFTKYCACHAKWISWLIRVTYETSFTMRGATNVKRQVHEILRLPRKMNLMIDSSASHMASILSWHLFSLGIYSL